MLIDEKINDLQNLIKRKISYDEVAPIKRLSIKRHGVTNAAKKI